MVLFVVFSGTSSYFGQTSVPPAIIIAPSSQTVCEGNTVSFPVTASGTGLSYQWRKGNVNIVNGGTISGANSATLLISTASPTDASADYNVVVSGNSAPSATSSNVSLNVDTAPALITAPCSETVCEGNSVSFTVTASGTGLSYQWRKGTVNLVDGGNISGTTTATLMISAASLTNAGTNYNVIVSGNCPPIVGSAYISLVVKTAPVITGQPSAQTVCAGSSASFSVSATGTGLTYQWRKGTVNLADGGTISGVTTPTLFISSVDPSNASNNYNVVVSGACAPSATSTNVSLVVDESPHLITAPCYHCGQSVCAGNSFSFAVTATGGGLTYQWRKGTVNLINGGTISGVNTATLVFSAVSFTDAANNYNVVISGNCPPAIGSAYFTLNVKSPGHYYGSTYFSNSLRRKSGKFLVFLPQVQI